ncbi:MAG: multicopper oxidase domain-containing protein [Chloroflexi bacterium]|nr:multicopper oxidase domain-containing protein [Chloroflexota bacterium]
MNTQGANPVNRRSFLKLAGVAAGAAVVSGCGSPAVSSQSEGADTISDHAAAATHTPDTTTSDTKAKPFKTYDATLPAIDKNPIKKVSWESSDDVLYITKDVAFQAWTFGGSVPGPILALTEGDEVQFSITNKGSAPHSIDFHAALTPPDKNYISFAPQATHQFTWKAHYPGCFMYHCGTPYVLHHMAMGMYGATIVKPKTGLQPVDREYVLVQSEFYLTPPADGLVQTDITKALTGIPDYVVFNGYAEQYKATPLIAKVGERIRMWVMNAGPTHYSAFHVIGTIFEAAYQDGNPANKMVGMQTVNVYPGGGMMVEFSIPEAGQYPFVSHSFADASKGALGVLAVTNS